MISEIAIRTEFPRDVREIENCWIEMPDGIRLAARIWLPDDAESNPVPAILEYLPYRKRDGTVERDHLTHPYFAGHGYAGIRVDMRGTGDSEGTCKGEYLQQEQDDCLAVLKWLAAQPWCTGKVGMIGISWGGFNGLQVAALRPAELGAVISLCSTDDRYADDIHFMGGAVLTSKLTWGATAFGISHTPPDPAIVVDRWLDMWRERLEGNGLWLLDWFKNQRRSPFYAHGSICENYRSIETPTYLVGGWADGYTNAVFRMLEHLECPRKGLIGPWGHKYPHFALPGPRIGFLQECLRWWDQHLKNIDTGIMSEPMLRAWIQDPADPKPFYEKRPGYWVTLSSWQGYAAKTKELAPGSGGLGTAAGAPIMLSSPQTTGHAAGDWCGYGLVPDGPVDQSAECGMVPFETEPLDEDLQLLGFPILTAEIESDAPQANLAAILSAVNKDGKATLFSYGVLNLTHRIRIGSPEPLPPKRTPIKLQLNACGQRIAKGQRLRLALANAYWPTIWPSQAQSTLTLFGAKIELPISTGTESEDKFHSPEGAFPLQTELISNGKFERTLSLDYTDGSETYVTHTDTGREKHLHTDIEIRTVETDRFTIHPDNPNSAVGCSTRLKQYERSDWRAELNVSVTVRAKSDDWEISATLKATSQDETVADKAWLETIPRDLV